MTIRYASRLPLFAALIAGMVCAGEAPAQDYPTRPITVIVPFAAGGLTDVPARVMATMMSQTIGQNMVVENKTGASGTIGAAFAARANPDGYTLLANSLADAQNGHFLTLNYSPVDDFSQDRLDRRRAAAGGDRERRASLQDAGGADYRREGQSEGAQLRHIGARILAGMALAMLNAAAKTSIVGVPYRGSGEAAQAVSGGQISGVFTYYSQAKLLVDVGKVRALAVAAPTRIPAWPDIPTFQELGVNIDFRGFVGLSAPIKTPKPILALLNAKLNQVVQSKEFKARMAELGMAPPPAADNTPEKYDDFLRKVTVRQGEIAKLAKAAEAQ